MNFKSFHFQVIFRLIVIIVLSVVSILLFQEGRYETTGFLLICVVTITLYSLFIYLNRVNRDLTRFTRSIKNNDFQENFTNPANDSYKELYYAFNSVRDQFITERNEKEDRYYVLQTVVEHIKIGLISFNENGEIDIYNNSARKLFDLPYLRNINELEQFDKALVSRFRASEINKKHLLSVRNNSRSFKLSFEIIEFKKNYETFRLVSIQDIKEELDQNELESWQKLIRVLNHEIFNSITPIISLSETTKGLFDSYDKLTDEDYVDIEKAFNTIEKRGKHLLEFVTKFRSITHLPNPEFQICLVGTIIKNVTTLFKSELNEKGINLSIKIDPESLEITIDISMIEQVLINIVKNAIDAMSCTDEKELTIVGELYRNKSAIRIEDTGVGIDSDTVDKLFIPFFTTKKTGSGIGLSLSKQLMKLNNGDIKISHLSKGTCVLLIFN